MKKFTEFLNESDKDEWQYLGTHRIKKLPDNVEIREYTGGVQQTFKNNKLHSINDEPSFVMPNGDKYWHKEGQWHRDNGPAVEYKSGHHEIWKNGKFVSCKHTKMVSY